MLGFTGVDVKRGAHSNPNRNIEWEREREGERVKTTRVYIAP
jgi:hypothetical protein